MTEAHVAHEATAHTLTEPELAAGAEPAVEEFDFVITLKGDSGTVTMTNKEFDNLPEKMYQLVIQKGLDVIFNSVGMSKLTPGITKLSGTEKAEVQEKVRKQAAKTKAEMIAGTLTIRSSGAKSKVAGAAQTEAMRLAKEQVKQLIREKGGRLGAFKQSAITELAKKVLEGNPRLYAQAEKNLKEREEEAKTTEGLDLKSLFGVTEFSDEQKAKPKVPPKPRAKKGEGAEGETTAAPARTTRAKPGSKPVPPKGGAKAAAAAQTAPAAEHHGHTAH